MTTQAPPTSATAPAAGRSGGQLARFSTIGLVSTVLHLGLFALLRGPLGEQVANGIALVVATVLNTAANRSWTFGVRGRHGLGRHHAQSLTVFALTWGLTSAALALLGTGWPHAPALVQVGCVAAANVISTAVRFVAMRRWIFRPVTV
ncbi:GtrA family protein [Dermatophilaceae bacterium Soc4.6]